MFFHCLTNRVSEVSSIREHCSDSNDSLKISTSVSPSSQPTDNNKRYTSLHELIGSVFTKPIGLMKLHLQNIMCMLLICTDFVLYMCSYMSLGNRFAKSDGNNVGLNSHLLSLI